MVEATKVFQLDFFLYECAW